MTDTNLISQVDDAITVAAWRLAIDADTGYTDGYERELAGEVYAGIPEEGRGEILRWLVGSAVSGITTGAVNMLDETAESTYSAIDEVTVKLVAAAEAQGRADRTVLHLIAHEIMEREDQARILGSRPA